MLYYSFFDYNGFKQVFGITEHGNGNVSRRNKILLAMLKDKEFFYNIRHATLKFRGYDEELTQDEREDIVRVFRNLSTMADLRAFCISLFTRFKPVNGWDCNVVIDDEKYLFAHPDYSVDNGGLCFDGDYRSIRYINHQSNDEHPYKMKSGKFLRRLIEASPWCILPECVKVWLCEDFAERWQAYSQRKLAGHTLHISDTREDFVRIYDRDNYMSDFGSCMSHDGGSQSSFYVDAVKAKAAWLENSEGQIVARCVIFTDVEDDEGNTYRLAERQYSADGDNVLKRLLVDKLIDAGEIDGYKAIGVDCHNATAWVANDGTSWSGKRFHIDCDLEEDDIVSYQDSFKWYDWQGHIAYNYPNDDADVALDTTDMRFNPYAGKVWSDYEDEYIDEDDAIWVENRDDYILYRHTEYCVNTDARECEEDCVQLANGDYAYYGYEREGYEGVYYCERCDEYYLEEDMTYSELLDEMMCDSCCHDAEQEYMEEHAGDGRFRYDVYDDEWYDTEECDDVRVLYWDYDQHRRRVGYTRKRHVLYNQSSFARYNNNWYFANVTLYNDVRVPRETIVA